MADKFPIDLSQFKKSVVKVVVSLNWTKLSTRLSLDPSKKTLSDEEKSTLKANIQLLRDAIVLFTATGAARGVGGHTGTKSA
jgi:hypothetical protein